MSVWFSKCAGDELDFTECMGSLLKYFFVDAKTDSSSFSTHFVFHDWCLYAFEENKTAMSRLALIAVASAVPSKNMPHYTLIQRRLLSHCDRVFLLAQQCVPEGLIDEMDFQWRSDACHELEALYSDQGRMKEAEEMYVRALTRYEKA